MTLKEIILEDAKKIAAENNGCISWFEFVNGWGNSIAELSAFRITLDRLDSVMRWASFEEYQYVRSVSKWDNLNNPGELFTDSQLYELYKEKNP